MQRKKDESFIPRLSECVPRCTCTSVRDYELCSRSYGKAIRTNYITVGQTDKHFRGGMFDVFIWHVSGVLKDMIFLIQL